MESISLEMDPMIKIYLKTYSFFFFLSQVGRKTQVATQRNSRGQFFIKK